jgi:spermidine/putrescine transport system substrate-binding protein
MMNYVYDPQVAGRIAAYVNYVTPVAGAQAEVEKIDPKLASSELIFPTAASRAKLHPQVDLTAAEQRTMNDAMQKVVGA